MAVVATSLSAAERGHLKAWMDDQHAALILECGDWPDGETASWFGLTRTREVTDGGYLWPVSPLLSLPAVPANCPIQVSGRRPLYALSGSGEVDILARGSAHPSAVVAFDATRDGFSDDEWFWCGPSISRVSRGRVVLENFSVAGLGTFTPSTASAGDFTGDGFHDDLLVATDDAFAVLRAGVWSAPRKAPARIKHAVSYPALGPFTAVSLFLGDGSRSVTSVDGAVTFGPPRPFAPAGRPVATDFGYSFEVLNGRGGVHIGLNVWAGDAFYTTGGFGWIPVPMVADLGPRYAGLNILRPTLGYCVDRQRRGIRSDLTLLVGSNLYDRDQASGSFNYPVAFHRAYDIAQHPLVVRRGNAVAYLYDFEDTVRRLQQGRPIGTATLRRGTARAVPLAPVINAFDDWIDYTNAHIPQADIHERFLRQVVRALVDLPLPRVWYLPRGYRSVTSLSHDVETSLLGQRALVRATTLAIARNSAAAGRRDTFFLLMTADRGLLTGADVATLEKLGHHVTLHFDSIGSTDFSSANLRRQADTLRGRGISRVVGNRTHALLWLSEQLPQALAAEPEIIFDATFGGGPGYSHCGSVFPYRIVDAQGAPFGTFHEIANALMDVADAKFYFSGIAPRGLPTLSVSELLTRARALALRNHEVYYGVFDCSFHPAVVAGTVPPIPEFRDQLGELGKFLTEAGIASMTLAEVAEWWSDRRGLSIVGVSWDGRGRLEFDLEAPKRVEHPSIVLPAEYGGRRLTTVSRRDGGGDLPLARHPLDGEDSVLVVLPEARDRLRLVARFS